MTTIWQDIRVGGRMLARRPGSAVAIILCLGLGIGGVTAVLSVLNGMFLRLMPYERPDRVVSFTVVGVFGKPNSNMPIPIYLDWKRRNESFAEMAAYQQHQPHIAWKGWVDTQENLQSLEGLAVTPTFFPVLGIRPVLGRVLAPEEKSFDAQPVIVLSYQVWTDVFGADTGILGHDVQLAGRTCKVIGVVEPSCRFLPFGGEKISRGVDYWIPVPGDFESEPLSNSNYSVIARLKPGVTPEQAQTEVDRLTQSIIELDPQHLAGRLRVLAQPLSEKLLGPARSASLLILGAAALVLLIACANVVNLFLVQSIGRKAEMAVRSALGSSRWRIVRQVIAENMSLVLLGGVVGALAAQCVVRVLVRIAPRSIPGLDQAEMDWRVLAATLAITLVSGLVLGLVPGISCSRLNLTGALQESGTRTTSGRRERRIVRLVVVSELVLAFMLVVSASLLIRSYWRLLQVELGIQPHHLLAFRLSGPKFNERHDELLQRLQTLPGVELAASSTGLPLSGEPSDERRVSPVPATEPPESCPLACVRTVSTDYFRALGASLVRGRSFTAQDNEKSNPVAIVNEALARRLWPEQDPLGQPVDFGNGNRYFYAGGEDRYVQRQVIGVVRNIQYGGPDENPPLEVFIPFAQRTRWHYILSVVLRCRADPIGLMQAVRREALSVDGSFKVESMTTIEGFYSALTAHRRFLMAMLATFAIAAFTLAVVGIYGVVAFTVSMRVRELGIRIAFGAQRRDILLLVMKHAAGLILAGVSFGLVGAFALRKVIASQLFGISPLDPATLTVGILLVVVVPLFACYLPAWRAARTDPMVALKCE